MATQRPQYLVTTDYRDHWIVLGPHGFAKMAESFNAAHALAKELNEHHERTQQLVGDILERHFGIVPPKPAEPFGDASQFEGRN